MSEVFIVDTVESIDRAVYELFSYIEKTGISILKRCTIPLFVSSSRGIPTFLESSLGRKNRNGVSDNSSASSGINHNSSMGSKNSDSDNPYTQVLKCLLSFLYASLLDIHFTYSLPISYSF